MPAHSSLSTHHSSLFFVGLDVGGSTMKAGVVDDAGRPLSAVSLPTEPEKGQEHGLKRMCETIREAVAAAKLRLDQIAAIGVATPFARAKPVIAHCTVATGTPNTEESFASATFTTVASIRKTVIPGMSARRTAYL